MNKNFTSEGKLLRKWLKIKGYTQEDFGKKIGRTRQSVKSYLEMETLSPAVKAVILKELDVNENDFSSPDNYEPNITNDKVGDQVEALKKLVTLHEEKEQREKLNEAVKKSDLLKIREIIAEVDQQVGDILGRTDTEETHDLTDKLYGPLIDAKRKALEQSIDNMNDVLTRLMRLSGIDVEEEK